MRRGVTQRKKRQYTKDKIAKSYVTEETKRIKTSVVACETVLTADQMNYMSGRTWILWEVEFTELWPRDKTIYNN